MKLPDDVKCSGVYVSHSGGHSPGDPCQQLARTDGYCHYHVSQGVTATKATKVTGCTATKRNGEVCGARCTGPWCHIHVARKVAQMPGPRVITRGMRDDVFKASDGECYVCATVIRSDAFHCAHVVPDVDGGAATLANLRATCSTCNLACGRQHLDDFKASRPRHEPTAESDIAQMKEELRKAIAAVNALADKINALEVKK